MTPSLRMPLAGLLLLVGGVVVALAGLRHPLLGGDGPAQLAVIAAAHGWRGIHLALSAGEVLLVAGVVGLALPHADSAGAGAARAGALLFAFGVGLALVQIFFMGGAGHALAAAYARGAPGLAATQAAFTYDMLHPFAQLAGRVGEFAVGLAALALGRGMVDGGRVPRWLGRVGVGAGAACALWAAVTAEQHPLLMAGFGLVVAWLTLSGAVLLGARRT